jgi:hypothetical protein
MLDGVSSRRVPERTLRRRFTLGSGPLKRTCDRVEVASRVVLVLVLLVGALAGAADYAASRSAGRAHAASRVMVTATLMADAPATGVPRITVAAGFWVPVQASWTGPDGVGRTGTVQASPGARAGTHVPVWVDLAGRVLPAPLTGDDAVVHGLASGVLVTIGIATAGVCGHATVLWLLTRRRLRRWADDWAAVEPLWIRRFR